MLLFGMDYDTEYAWHRVLAHIILWQSPLIFVILRFGVDSPYGKTLDVRFGPLIPSKVAWVIFESPNLIWSAVLYDSSRPFVNQLLLGLFVLHYLQRTLLYPLLMHHNTAPMPASIAATAFFFCCCNGYLQAQNLCQFTTFSSDWMGTAQFWCGLILFGVGMLTNLYHDHILRTLRQFPKRQVPHAGLFRYVTAPHYLGEIVEWLGFVVATNCTLAPLAFWIYTMANLVPRALSHHAWYQRTFPKTFPRQRKAIIPFLW